MPVYSTTPTCQSVTLGQSVTIVNAEQLTTAIASQRVAIAPHPGGTYGPIALTFAYASAPSSVQYDIQVANVDLAANYITVGSTTNVNGDRVDIDMSSLHFNFIRVLETTSPGVNATVKVFG